MSQTAITLVFEQWKAQQAATGEPVLLDEFVFALVPGLDPDLPVDRSETLPPAAQIVCREPVTRKGVVNENAVVHSAVLGADVGDFSFNWIGLTNKATGTLAMIVHAPEQQKLKTKEGQQGNVLTRSFLMEFTAAQAETAINTPAETWQIDFTARMGGMDERQRLENIDIYGSGAFFDNGWLVGKTGNQFFVTSGVGYVAGLRTALAANQSITVTTKPVKVWLDVCWTGSLTSVWNVQSKVTVASSLENYEQDGVEHYVFALASIDADGEITDLRPKGSFDEQMASDALKKHEQSRNHPDATLQDKGFVKLFSGVTSDSESEAATPKAVRIAMDNGNARLAKDRNGADIPNAALFRQNLQLEKVGNYAALPLTGGTLTGDFAINGTGYVEKRGVSAVVNNERYTNGYRIYGAGDLFADLYHYERIGKHHYLGLHVANGSANGWFEFRNDGTFVSNNGAILGGNLTVSWDGRTATYQENGDVNASVWGGYLSNFIVGKFNQSIINIYQGSRSWVHYGQVWISWTCPGGHFITGISQRRFNDPCWIEDVEYAPLWKVTPTGQWII